jgi:hypothetical protein
LCILDIGYYTIVVFATNELLDRLELKKQTPAAAAAAAISIRFSINYTPHTHFFFIHSKK